MPRTSITNFDDVADQELITFRQKSNLDHFVPFHFFSKNPFDGTVQKANPDKIFIYITIHRTTAQNKNFKVLPSHPGSLDNIGIFDYNDGFDKINWDLMEQRDYSNQNCKNTCMAECLSPDPVTPDMFQCIYVKDSNTELIVRKKCDTLLNRYSFYITVFPNMFVE